MILGRFCGIQNDPDIGFFQFELNRPWNMLGKGPCYPKLLSYTFFNALSAMSVPTGSIFKLLSCMSLQHKGRNTNIEIYKQSIILTCQPLGQRPLNSTLSIQRREQSAPQTPPPAQTTFACVGCVLWLFLCVHLKTLCCTALTPFCHGNQIP